MSDKYWIDYQVEEAALSRARAMRARAASAERRVTPLMAGRANRLLTENASLSGDLLQGILTADIPDGPSLQRVIDEDDGGESDGGLWGSIRNFVGDRISDVAGVADDALSVAYEQAIKPLFRGVALTSDFLYNEVVARPLTSFWATGEGEFGLGDEVRNYRNYGDSAVLNAIQGDTDNDAPGGIFGTGLFAGGRAQAEAESERVMSIRGQRATLGRAIAASTVGEFVEPGDMVYDLTAGISNFASEVFLDPTGYLTAGVSSGMKAARAIDRGVDLLQSAKKVPLSESLALRAGLVRGERRNTIIAERTRNFLADEGMLDRLAKADTYTIYQEWSKSPANRVNLAAIRRLGEADTQAKVAEVLYDTIRQGDITEQGFFSGPGHFVRRQLTESPYTKPLRFLTREGKYAGLAPTGQISAENVDDMAGKVDSLLRQANVTRDERAQMFERIAGIEPGDHSETFGVLRDTIRLIEPQLHGAKGTKLVDDLIDHYQSNVEAFRQYAVDAIGDPIQTPFTKTKVLQSGREVVIPSPQLLSELNSLALTLPDVQDIRRAANSNRAMRAIYTSKGWDYTARAANTATTKIFKPLAIIRLAYMMRVGPEEQARLIAAGHDSIFSSPGRFIMANILGRDELVDLAGNPLLKVSEMHGVVAHKSIGLLDDPVASRSRAFDITTAPAVGQQASNDFIRGWQGEMGQLSSDPIARKLAELRGDTGALKEWVRDQGMPWLRTYAKSQGKEGKALLRLDGKFDEWADTIRERIEAKTANWDDDLVDAIAHDKVPFKADGDSEVKAFRRFLRSKSESGVQPDAVKVELVSEARRRGLDTLVDGLFDVIVAKPSNYLARFPAFRQSIVLRTTEALDLLANDELRDEVVEAALKGLKLTAKEKGKLLDAAKQHRGKVGVVDNLGDFNEAIVSKSADDVRDLLFDVTKRGAAQEAFNVVVPFLDAWKEVTTTWMRLLKDNPTFFVRAQAGYRELRDQGIFYANDFGEEVFRYPGGGLLADAFGAEDSGVALEGRVAGLNLIAQGVGPGFGPLIQWPAGMLKDPKYEVIQDFMAPFGVEFGGPTELLNLGDVAETFLPAWFKKFSNAMTGGAIDARQWNSTVGDALQAYSISGEYDLNDPEQVQDMVQAAERYATFILLGRSFTQFAGPTGASASLEVKAEDADPGSPDWNPEIDPNGKWFRLNVLAQEYHRLEGIYGDSAAQRFFEMYGKEPWYLAQGATSSLGKKLPVTTEGGRWIEQNRDVFEDYPLVAGFFAPVDEEADLDFEVYAGQVNRDERISLSGEIQSRLAQQTRARAIYSEAQRQLDLQEVPYAEKQTQLAMVSGRLEQVSPGWRSPVLAMPRQEDKISQLYRAASDDRLADNPLTEALRAYLELRDGALAEVRTITGRGNATLNSEEGEPYRRELMAFGQQLMAGDPGFTGIWTSLLKRELEED